MNLLWHPHQFLRLNKETGAVLREFRNGHKLSRPISFGRSRHQDPFTLIVSGGLQDITRSFNIGINIGIGRMITERDYDQSC